MALPRIIQSPDCSADVVAISLLRTLNQSSDNNIIVAGRNMLCLYTSQRSKPQRSRQAFFIALKGWLDYVLTLSTLLLLEIHRISRGTNVDVRKSVGKQSTGALNALATWSNEGRFQLGPIADGRARRVDMPSHYGNCEEELYNKDENKRSYRSARDREKDHGTSYT